MEELEFWLGIALCVAAGLALLVAWVLWNRRGRNRGSRALLVFMLGVAWWDLGSAFHKLGVPSPSAVFWLDFGLVGALVVPTAFWVFVVRLTERNHWLTPRVLMWLTLIPLLSLGMLLTNGVFGLFWQDAAGRVGGAGADLTLVYSYVLLLWALALLVTALLDATGVYRWQLLTLTLGALIPVGVSLLELTGNSPRPDLPLTPLAFLLTGLLIMYSLSRFRLLEVVPVARSALIEHMRDGMLVLDERNRILDANPAALRMLGPAGREVIGRRMGEVLPSHWVGHLLGVQARQEEVRQGELHVELRVTPIPDERGQVRGRLVELSDISHLKRAEQELRDQLAENQLLQSKLQEETVRDPLTGLHNRRHLDEVLPKELQKARRKGVSVSVAMLDIDHFKLLNDTHGHGAGDGVLIALGQLLLSRTRAEDTVCRYGGEEIVLLMPGVGLDVAEQRLETLRRAFERLDLAYGEARLSVSFSVGIAVYPQQAETPLALLEKADQALYAAKRAGRSRVMLWRPEAVALENPEAVAPGRPEAGAPELVEEAARAELEAVLPEASATTLEKSEVSTLERPKVEKPANPA
ncbi:MAG: diguanylate cyclase [Meiothermus sp.]|nr:diguanylate cyclase [Meiothermus sp.]